MNDRQGYIGSSEIATVLGFNPFQTPLELWGIKTGNILPKDLSENESVEWGTRLEKVVSQKFSEKHNVKLISYKKRFVHPVYAFLTCELDNVIAGTDEIVEIKTTSAFNYKEWADPEDIPIYYVCQVMFALGLSGRKVGHVAVLIGGQRYLEKKIIFDKELFDKMVNKAVEFWNNFIVPKVMPVQITKNDGDVLYKMFPNPTDTIIQLDDKAEVLIETIKANKADLMSLKDMIDKNENELKALLKENNYGEGVKFKVSWKLQIQRRLNTDLVKQDFPAVYEQCARPVEFRKLNIYDRKEQK